MERQISQPNDLSNLPSTGEEFTREPGMPEMAGQQPLPIAPEFIDYDQVEMIDHVHQLSWHAEDLAMREAQAREEALNSQLDRMTGLQGEQNFMATFEREIEKQIKIKQRLHAQAMGGSEARESDEREQGLALLFVDLDGFKAVNDAFGHKVGDNIIIEAGKKITETIREDKDTAGRWYGDEFFILINSGIDEEAVKAVIARLEDSIGSIVVRDNGGTEYSHVVSASIGVSYFEEGKTPDGMFDESEADMYRVKQEGVDSGIKKGR